MGEEGGDSPAAGRFSPDPKIQSLDHNKPARRHSLKRPPPTSPLTNSQLTTHHLPLTTHQPMNVCLTSYQSVMMLKGGPRTQILQTKRCLEQLGVNVSLFASWEEFGKERFDLIHLFGANIGTYHFARELHKIGI